MAGKCARCRATLTVGVAFSPLPTTQILMPLHGVARVFSREWGHVCQANRCPSFAKMRLSGPGSSADAVPLLIDGRWQTATCQSKGQRRYLKGLRAVDQLGVRAAMRMHVGGLAAQVPNTVAAGRYWNTYGVTQGPPMSGRDDVVRPTPGGKLSGKPARRLLVRPQLGRLVLGAG
jgi:hypothetical protein